ncbi:dipeptidyl-peptidase III [Suhomyces tanzawaensis NRRL Y-17324]|uniref:Dipeptidyl peptidase 3 n=1 Tax=Suhomyces tanzawaensis NRRL Y-17324 TaxID=984487 RepID=A0A1E4SCW1_9ASCO|nr:dipeptidyl-peptidase III [Suhomyces tanzawaensis NRRL Y-17324]ODV77354.1 dipeptidyl-peptidase III [Suhomyces tanzawaensis NRRL Y-17324]
MSASEYHADAEAPVVMLSAKKHFDSLPTETAKLYAHYLSRASHYGTRAVLRSVSPESEDTYDLILKVHQALGAPATNEAYQKALESKVSATVILQYLEYASQFLSNLGNFKSFGDQKFIPRLSIEEFDHLIEAVNDADASQLYKNVREALYSLDASLLGWPEKGQVSSYYLGQTITRPEIEAVNEVLAKNGIMPENTRVEKKSDKEFVVHVASAETTNKTSYYPESLTTPSGASVTFKFGDHSKDFSQIVASLEQALKYVSNETQEKMIKFYIESFKTGSMNAHKDSQIQWVKDLQPTVENNIGFIETYRDPSGVRGEWEGLVAMVNQERTAKFSVLVDNAKLLIAHLPWDSIYEKDVFTPPDFTSLEVLTFAGSGVPAGINIPNYDDVRLNIGFKNVSLGNVLSAEPKKKKNNEALSFLKADEEELFRKWRVDAFEVQVGLHELLGHGTGKLLQETAPGVFNFDKEKTDVKSWYAPNATWGSLFSSVAGSYEECRAELVALYLILKKPLEVLPIFDIKDEKEQKDVILIATLLMVRAGLLALEFWDPESKKWGQPHMQARFGISKVLHEAGVFTFDFKDEENFSDMVINLDQSKLSTVAVEALGDFLLKLHVYKCSGNVEAGIPYYNDKTEVTEQYARFRNAVLSKKLPRRHLIQANTVIKSGDVEVVEYEETEVGMIQSFVDRDV